MAPHMEDPSPNGEGGTLKFGEAASGNLNRLSSSSSAPLIGVRKGVSIMIDTAAPMLDDDTDTLQLPRSCAGSPSNAGPQKNSGGKAAWSSGFQESGSRPGSRQSMRPTSSSGCFSSSLGSSRQQSTSGRFSPEELLCFRRVPTPTPSCEHKSQFYFDPGGPGQLRGKLANENWNTLPVLKGKFYTHPRLSDSVNLITGEKARELKKHQKRQNQLLNQRAENLPDEDLTTCLLDQIFPKTGAAFQLVGVGVNLENDRSDTPTGDANRKCMQKSRSGTTTANNGKRRSASESMSEPSKLEVGVTEPSSSSGANAGLSSPTHFNNSAMLSSTGGASSAPAGRERLETAQRREILLEFRKQIFEKFNTIKEGFDYFEKEFPANREMTKKEWRRVLSKLGFVATVEERDAIFEQLDINNNGHVSILEFHTSIEAAIPVKCMEDLRRRWLASNYPCMSHAFTIMDEGSPNKRLSLREFGELLSRVQVTDPAEHIALFNAIGDQTCPTSCKVSIGELASALATVSPSAHMEEVRHRLLKRYFGSVEKAFWDIDCDHSGVVSLGEFKARAIFRIGLTEKEATSFFHTLDCNGSGSVSLSEFLCALSMSEPSLFFEDLRKKIRQRFRSIRDTFTDAMEDFANSDLHQNPKLPFSRYEFLLKDMELEQAELRTLFDLIDADRAGELTMTEFLQGMYHFAPSCVLEDLRLTCLQKHEHIWEGFTDLEVGRNAPLDVEAFEKVLEKQGLSKGLEIDKVFSLLDSRNEGFITVGKIIAALQAGGPGNNQRPPSAERDQRAMQDVKAVFMHHHKFAGDVRIQTRQPLHTPEGSTCPGAASPTHGESQAEASCESPTAGSSMPPTPHRQLAPRKRLQHSKTSGAMAAFESMKTQAWGSTATSGATNKVPASPKGGANGNPKQHQDTQKSNPAGGGTDSGAAPMDDVDEVIAAAEKNMAPRLRFQPPEELAKYMAKLDPSRLLSQPWQIAKLNQEHKKAKQEDPIVGTQQSWGRLWQCVHNTLDPKESFELEKETMQYYQKASKSVSHDVPLLERSHSRHAIYRSVRAHSRALANPRTAKLMAEAAAWRPQAKTSCP